MVVGEFRITVSERRAASSIFAVDSSGLRPLALKRSMIRVAVEPTGSKVAGMGEVVSMSPMWWWSRISTTSAFSTPADALPDLGVVDEEHAPRAGVEEVGPRDDPDGHPLLVDGDRGPVVDLHDLLGYLRYEVVGPDGQGVLAHDLPAGDGELYQAASDVGVEGREQYGVPLPGQLEDLVVGTYPVGDDEHAGAELYGSLAWGGPRLCRPVSSPRVS